ncbi:uncharacterized protein LOC107621313 [Arachis ipaensis]|uniref:uncharacterized protein LOC107621313 n=1 Tax=Arachis ipaensis TaxID=130454 RepID=UPI0007AF0094|nr:uncharacterized protein LOC107621313 [Arachis ipaensis]
MSVWYRYVVRLGLEGPGGAGGGGQLRKVWDGRKQERNRDDIKMAQRGRRSELFSSNPQNGAARGDCHKSMRVTVHDYSFFALGEGEATTYLIVYVDDIIIAAPKHEMVDNVKHKLQSIFKLKILGDLKFFLGLELSLSKDGITLSQRKYTLSLLEETGFLGCKPANTPMDANMKLRLDEGDHIPDASSYRRLIGRLKYLTISRPDITFAVVKLAQYMENPRTPHLEAVHHVLRYLKAAPTQGLLFSSKSKFHLSMYTDADWGSCLDTRRSTTGYCTFLGDSLVSWKSKKQDVVSRSSTETEYRALANVACEVLSIISLLKFMHVEVNSAMIFCDNVSAIQTATNPTLHERSKHIEIDCHFVREKVAAMKGPSTLK